MARYTKHLQHQTRTIKSTAIARYVGMTKATSANIVATVIWHHVPGTQGRLEVRFLHAKLTDDYATEGRSSYRGRACRTDAQQALEDEHSLVVLDPVTVDEMGMLGFDTPEYPPNGSHNHLNAIVNLTDDLFEGADQFRGIIRHRFLETPQSAEHSYYLDPCPLDSETVMDPMPPLWKPVIPQSLAWVLLESSGASMSEEDEPDDSQAHVSPLSASLGTA